MNTVKLPKVLNSFTCAEVIEAYKRMKISGITAVNLDFSTLAFTNPAGAVSLASIIYYFTAQGIETKIIGQDIRSQANRYLDDCGFFHDMLGESVFYDIKSRTTTVQFSRFEDGGYMQYLLYDLCPWIQQEVSISEDTLTTIRTCLEEIFHNVQYHSGVATGFVLAQHYPKKNTIEIAISDFGKTIPAQVRTLKPNLGDAAAILQACQEGFSTKSNVRNRGAGLPILIRYVAARNCGRVEIRSAKGFLSAKPAKSSYRLTESNIGWVYPGTLVTVTLRTDTFERLDSDVEKEEFSW